VAPGRVIDREIDFEGASELHRGQLVPRFRVVPQPVIAAVNGPAAGAGLALVRWKPALNAFAITFADRFPAAETYRTETPETPFTR
jgi:hypothetical protein